MFPIRVVAYVRLARREEGEAVAALGDEWADYARRTPAFFPQWASRNTAGASDETTGR